MKKALAILALASLIGCTSHKPPPDYAVSGQSVEEWEQTLEYQAKPQSLKWTEANKAWGIAAITGQLADLVTTASALNDGATEANPLMGNNIGGVLAVKAVVIGGVLFITEYCYKGDPAQQKVRNYLYGTLAAFGFGAAAWNTGQMK